jgi:hypothetical protein
MGSTILVVFIIDSWGIGIYASWLMFEQVGLYAGRLIRKYIYTVDKIIGKCFICSPTKQKIKSIDIPRKIYTCVSINFLYNNNHSQKQNFVNTFLSPREDQMLIVLSSKYSNYWQKSLSFIIFFYFYEMK